uniref:Uncharacterized protein n=1 Tax=viral metagenome TaxID=1070528 RepID=A0A6M3KH68_9ZZZZ
MVETQKDEIVDSSPTTEEPQEEVQEVTEEAEPTAEQGTQAEGQTQDTEFGPVPYDRFKEINERMKAAEDRSAQLEQRYFQAIDNQQKGIETKADTDIIQKYGAQDANTREFLRELKDEMRKEANKVADERAAPIIRENEALRRTVASMQEKMFRQENTDVPADSKEEREIAQLISIGVPLEKATWAVMGPKRVEGAKKQGVVKTATKTQAKLNANLETRSVPQTSGLPQNRNLSFKDDLREQMRKAGL